MIQHVICKLDREALCNVSSKLVLTKKVTSLGAAEEQCMKVLNADSDLAIKAHSEH